MNLVSGLIDIITPMAMGILMAIAYMVVQVWGGRNPPSVGEKRKLARAHALEALSLKLLLPLFVAESMMRAPVGRDLLFSCVAGFLLPLACFVISRVYVRMTVASACAPADGDSFPFIASTFGGGNRGTIFIIALFGSTSQFQDYLKYFTLVDLGNFTFLFLIVPALLKRQFSAKPAKGTSLLDNYVLVTILVVVGFFVVRSAVRAVGSYDIAEVLTRTLQFRKFLFTLLLFSAITLRIRIEHVLPKRFLGDAVSFYAVRSVCIALVCTVLLFSLPDPFGMVVVCATILLLMPPSSLLPSLVAQSHASDAAIGYVNAMTSVFNILYLLCLGAVVIARVILAS